LSEYLRVVAEGGGVGKRFFYALGGSTAFLATLLGAYYGAAALGQVSRLLALLIPAAILVALVRAFGRPALSLVRTLSARIRKYDSVLKAAAQAAARVSDLEAEVERLEKQAIRDHAAGLAEGRRRAVAEALGYESHAALEPVSLMVEDGNLLIAAKLREGDVPLPVAGCSSECVVPG
jgi:hypothetical protein